MKEQVIGGAGLIGALFVVNILILVAALLTEFAIPDSWRMQEYDNNGKLIFWSKKRQAVSVLSFITVAVVYYVCLSLGFWEVLESNMYPDVFVFMLPTMLGAMYFLSSTFESEVSKREKFKAVVVCFQSVILIGFAVGSISNTKALEFAKSEYQRGLTVQVGEQVGNYVRMNFLDLRNDSIQEVMYPASNSRVDSFVSAGEILKERGQSIKRHESTVDDMTGSISLALLGMALMLLMMYLILGGDLRSSPKNDPEDTEKNLEKTKQKKKSFFERLGFSRDKKVAEADDGGDGSDNPADADDDVEDPDSGNEE